VALAAGLDQTPKQQHAIVEELSAVEEKSAVMQQSAVLGLSARQLEKKLDTMYNQVDNQPS
jgi:hypothetical protein